MREARAYTASVKQLQASVTTPAAMTLRTFSKLWLDGHASSLQPATRRSYEGSLHRSILPTLGNTRLNYLSPLGIGKWHNELAEQHSAVVANKALATLKVMLAHAVRWGYIKHNPAAPVRKKRTTRKHGIRVFTAAELATITTHLSDQRDRVLVLLLAYSGLRISEAVALKWEHVEDQKWILVQWAMCVEGTLKEPKSYQQRRTPILLPARAELEAWRRVNRTAWVFPRDSGSGPLRPDVFRKRWNAALEAGGVEPGRIHDLRHTFASVIISKGVDVKRVQAWMGHSSPITTLRIYTHLTSDDDATLDLLDEGSF
jgi:integrase